MKCKMNDMNLVATGQQIICDMNLVTTGQDGFEYFAGRYPLPNDIWHRIWPSRKHYIEYVCLCDKCVC